MSDFKRIDEIIVKIIDDFNLLHNELNSKTTEAKVEKPEVKEKPIALEDVRGVLAGLTRGGKTKEVKDLLKKYGASKLSAVDPINYASLLKDAKDIKLDA